MRGTRLSWILAFYLVREILLYGALGLVLVVSLMVSQSLVAESDVLFSIRIETREMLTLVGWVVGLISAHALPMAFLFGVVLAISRMSSDSEVLAMRCNGLGMRQLVAPVLALAILTSALDGYFLISVEHRAMQQLRELIKSMAARGALLETRRFLRFGGRVVYIHERDRDNRLRRILISDESDPDYPFVVLSEKGSFRFDPEEASFHFQLEGGEVHVEPRVGDDRYRRMYFETMDYRVDASTYLATGTGQLRPRGMSLAELNEVLARARRGEPIDLAEKNPRAYAVEVQRRFGLPFGAIPLALLAIPLSLRRSRGGRSWGALVCLALVLGHYFTLSFTKILAADAWLWPPLAYWGPNLLLLVLGIVLLRRASRSEV